MIVRRHQQQHGLHASTARVGKRANTTSPECTDGLRLHPNQGEHTDASMQNTKAAVLAKFTAFGQAGGQAGKDGGVVGSKSATLAINMLALAYFIPIPCAALA